MVSLAISGMANANVTDKDILNDQMTTDDVDDRWWCCYSQLYILYFSLENGTTFASIGGYNPFLKSNGVFFRERISSISTVNLIF